MPPSTTCSTEALRECAKTTGGSREPAAMVLHERELPPDLDRGCLHEGLELRRRGDLLPSPGDYLAIDVAGIPILLTHGEQGDIKAFANS
jgi:hypothetical protein